MASLTAMRDWSYEAGAGGRDLRLDLLRGLCLAKMIFNHLWHTPLHAVQDWIGYLTAAEAFFFISGVVAAIVYGRRAREQGLAVARQGLWRRSLHLYVANLALVFLVFALEAKGWLHSRYLWHEGFAWTDFFSVSQPYFLQMLPRYAVYLAFAPFVLQALLAGRTAWVVAASGGLWLANLLLGYRLQVPFLEPDPAGGFLLVAWQLLFFGGMVVGFHREALAQAWRRLPRWAGFWLPLAVYLAFIVFERASHFGLLDLHPGYLWNAVGREHLGAVRVVNLAVAFASFFLLVDRFWKPVARFLGPFLLPFGQSALYVFLVHILLNAARLIVEPHLPFELAGHAVRLLAATLLLLAAHWWMVRYRVLAAVIPR